MYIFLYEKKENKWKKKKNLNDAIQFMRTNLIQFQ